ncbi:hypothetical protein VTI74DRAFT_1439 [Chaetomium olivicolor]
MEQAQIGAAAVQHDHLDVSVRKKCTTLLTTITPVSITGGFSILPARDAKISTATPAQSQELTNHPPSPACQRFRGHDPIRSHGKSPRQEKGFVGGIPPIPNGPTNQNRHSCSNWTRRSGPQDGSSRIGPTSSRVTLGQGRWGSSTNQIGIH